MSNFANYQYSLTRDQQAAIETFLEELPLWAADSPVCELLQQLTYPNSWTDHPVFELPKYSEQENEIATATKCSWS